MRRLLIPLFLVTALFAGFCKTAPTDHVLPVLDTERLYYDDSPAFADSARYVIRTFTEWRDVWERATAMQASPPRRPPLDFSTHMVLIASAGRMSPGDIITVDSAGLRTDGIYYAYVRTIRGCQRFEADVYPFEFVRVVFSEAPVKWIESVEDAENCR
ncbi:MAG TPA: hypothetical protein VLC48_10710 [Gemmatimonadota bacterium]|nr:hypothetical protein [Gemmatimonadota bacterium]